MKAQFHFAGMPKLKNYLWTHEKYIEPGYILKNDHVTSMGKEIFLVFTSRKLKYLIFSKGVDEK